MPKKGKGIFRSKRNISFISNTYQQVGPGTYFNNRENTNNNENILKKLIKQKNCIFYKIKKICF